MQILPSAARFSRPGPAAWFTGQVLLEEIATPPLPSRFTAVRVSFEPRARTAWHTHPLGQTLHIVSGRGRVQLHGHSAQDLSPGDTVYIAPDELHWHGAAPNEPMVHLAFQEMDTSNVAVRWLDPVTDQQYDNA